MNNSDYQKELNSLLDEVYYCKATESIERLSQEIEYSPRIEGYLFKDFNLEKIKKILYSGYDTIVFKKYPSLEKAFYEISKHVNSEKYTAGSIKKYIDQYNEAMHSIVNNPNNLIK